MTEVRGADVWEHTLFEVLKRHVAEEKDVEAGYRQFAAETEAKDVRFLLELILEDEERHHRWLDQLANSVRGLVEQNPEADIPWMGHLAERGELLEVTKRFLGIERADARHLRQLMRELQEVEDTTLWALLVRLMLLDTAKHIEILRFLQRRAKR